MHRTGLHSFPEDRILMDREMQACAAEMLLHLLAHMLFLLRLVEVFLQQLREEAPFRVIRTMDMPFPARPVR